jgi:hypothetical protein
MALGSIVFQTVLYEQERDMTRIIPWKKDNRVNRQCTYKEMQFTPSSETIVSSHTIASILKLSHLINASFMDWGS